MPPTLYLASGSPRRRELLTQIGIPFQPLAVAVSEQPLPGEEPLQYVERLALEKAQAGRHCCSGPVLGADTAVVLEGAILGKPAGEAEAIAMLEQLGGRSHQVYTGVALVTAEGQAQGRVSVSTVTFRPLRCGEAAAYWATGEPADKAGAYAIQGRAAVWIERIEGSYSGVMGLPLFETAQLLETAGIHSFGPDCA